MGLALEVVEPEVVEGFNEQMLQELYVAVVLVVEGLPVVVVEGEVEGEDEVVVEGVLEPPPGRLGGGA